MSEARRDLLASVRTVTEAGSAWYCLADIGTFLEMSNPRMFLRSKFYNQSGIKKFPVETNSGEQMLTFIDEANLSVLISRSNKEAARNFPVTVG